MTSFFLISETYLLLMHSHPWEEINAQFLTEAGLAQKYDSNRTLIEQIEECLKLGLHQSRNKLFLQDWKKFFDALFK